MSEFKSPPGRSLTAFGHALTCPALTPFARDSARTFLATTTGEPPARHVGVAVESLVDNAARHNPAPHPVVRVRATATGADGWVEDDGPQIPTDERRVVLGDAAITPVRHGSGLGLWVVTWVTESFGGEVSFAESDLGGNAVRLRLPRPESDRP